MTFARTHTPIPEELPVIGADFVRELRDMAQQAQRAEIIKADQEPGHVYYLQNPGAAAVRVVGEPPRKTPLFGNLDSLIEWGWENEQHKPRAWVTLTGIVVTLDDPRRSFGRYPLPVPAPLAHLDKLALAPQAMTQKQAVRMLAVTLYECVPPEIVALFRTVAFTTNDSAAATYQKTQANIGRSLEAKINTPAEIPDDLAITVPMTGEPFLPIARRPVRVAVEVDLEQRNFTFHVLPLELDRARALAEIDLTELVVSAVTRGMDQGTGDPSNDAHRQAAVERYPVYIGAPTGGKE